MNNGLLLLGIGLTALVGSICTLLYSRMRVLSDLLEQQNDRISSLDNILRNVVEIQTSTQHCISEMSTEMQLRDVYQNANDRHKLAIKAAKNGKSRMELMRQHGLSTDEASLIISLHGGNVDSDETPLQNETPSSSKVARLTEV
jgi:hypothetical protein